MIHWYALMIIHFIIINAILNQHTFSSVHYLIGRNYSLWQYWEIYKMKIHVWFRYFWNIEKSLSKRCPKRMTQINIALYRTHLYYWFQGFNYTIYIHIYIYIIRKAASLVYNSCAWWLKHNWLIAVSWLMLMTSTLLLSNFFSVNRFMNYAFYVKKHSNNINIF